MPWAAHPPPLATADPWAFQGCPAHLKTGSLWGGGGPPQISFLGLTHMCAHMLVACKCITAPGQLTLGRQGLKDAQLAATWPDTELLTESLQV